MKNMKRKVFVVAVALCLVAILSMGTLAWFSDNEEVKNEFLFATTEDDEADEIFNVVLTEEDAPEDKKYEDVLPGDVLAKDPTVTNKGYYDQYIRVTVTIENAAMFRAHIMGGDSTFRPEVFVGFNNQTWASFADDGAYSGKYDATTDTLTYVFYYNGILAGEQTTATDKISSVELFSALNIPEGLTREDAAEINDAVADGVTTSFGIKIVADAVQTENVGASTTNTAAQNAKIAFATVGM